MTSEGRIYNATVLALILSLVHLSNSSSIFSGNSTLRYKRQNCEFPCKDGECVPEDVVCDGIANCKDSSDETMELCSRQTCPPYLFRCNYGPCITKSKVCDGKKDCVDNSDETGPGCRKEPGCAPSQFRCKDGQCISDLEICDGDPTCADGSDETLEACGSSTCASYLYRCAYGACVNKNARCNGKRDCADGSDEAGCPGATVPTSRPPPLPTQAPPIDGGCLLPEHPPNGQFSISGDKKSYTPNTFIASSSSIDLTCNHGYQSQGGTIYYSFSPGDVDAACARMNADLEVLVDVSKRHNLSINPRKTEVILFGPKTAREVVRGHLQLFVDGDALNIKTSVKNLGVIIDENLKFNEHINKCAQRAYCNLRAIYNNRCYLSIKTKRMLCDTLVLSCFSYADVLYSPFLTVRLKYKIQKVQNSCLRTIYGIRRRDHISHKLVDINWLNMSSRRILHSACFFINVVVSGKPPYLYNRIKFRSDVHTLNVRFRGLLTPPIHRLELCKSGFTYQICSVYNKIILAGFGQCASTYIFKRKYRNYLFELQCS